MRIGNLRSALLGSLFLGPSMILAVQLSGKNFNNFFEGGAEYGLSLLLIVILSLIFKFAMVDGLARYTLYHGDSVFSRLPNVTGPKNWAVWAVTTIYIFELASYTGVAVLAGTLVKQMLPFDVPVVVLFLGTMASVSIILLKRSFSTLEKMIFLILGVVVSILIYCAIAIILDPAQGGSLLRAPSPDQATVDPLMLIGSGSGMALLLYSVYLTKKAKTIGPGTDFRTVLREVRTSLALSFLLTGLITSGFVIVAWFCGTGNILMAAESSLTALPFASLGFVFTVSILMFGITLVGIDGRARAISRMLVQTNTTSLDRHLLYKLLVVGFISIVLLTYVVGQPSDVLELLTALSSVMFALTGFALIYINFKLPVHAKGGTIWMSITLMGSSLFLAIAIIKEETLLEFGLPLMVRVLLVSFLLYLLYRIRVMDWMLENIRSWKGATVAIVLFSSISIFGTAAGIEYNGLIINFRDLGAMMAGLLGGPIIGTTVGIISGAYRYGQGGWTMWPCLIATITAGALSGLLSLLWKGRINYLKVIFLGTLVEVLHVYVIFPIMEYGTPDWKIIEVMRSTTLPMVVANVLGLIFFVYVLELVKAPVIEADRSPASVTAES